MDPDFWQQRWSEGRIGFHQDRVTPLLEQHWDAVVRSGGRPGVRSARRQVAGHAVAGRARISRARCRTVADRGRAVLRGAAACRRQSGETPYGARYAAGAIEMLCGDVFALDAQALAACAGVYDRAALIALPPPMRERYVHELHARLPSGCRGLLVTLDYPPGMKSRGRRSRSTPTKCIACTAATGTSNCSSGATSWPRNRASSPRASPHCTPRPGESTAADPLSSAGRTRARGAHGTLSQTRCSRPARRCCCC